MAQKDAIEKDRLLSLQETATFLGLSVTTIHRLIRSGHLPAIRITKRLWRFRRSEIEKYLEDQQRETARRIKACSKRRTK